MSIEVDSISFKGFGSKRNVWHKNKVKAIKTTAMKLGLKSNSADAFVKKEIIKSNNKRYDKI